MLHPKMHAQLICKYNKNVFNPKFLKENIA